jgi:hypothetical protein
MGCFDNSSLSTVAVALHWASVPGLQSRESVRHKYAHEYCLTRRNQAVVISETSVALLTFARYRGSGTSGYPEPADICLKVGHDRFLARTIQCTNRGAISTLRCETVLKTLQAAEYLRATTLERVRT